MIQEWRVWRYRDGNPEEIWTVEAATAFGALQRGKLRLDVGSFDDAHIFVTPIMPWEKRWQ